MGFGRASRGARRARQGSGPLHPLAALVLLPVARLRLGPVLKRPPDGSGRFEVGRVEKVEGAFEAQGRLAPFAVGQRDMARSVGRLGRFGEQDRLMLRVGPAVGQEGLASIGPELL